MVQLFEEKDCEPIFAVGFHFGYFWEYQSSEILVKDQLQKSYIEK